METAKGAVPPDLENPAVLRDLARVVFTLFERWALSAGQQLMLLGMDPHEAGVLSALRHGQISLPSSPDVLQRVEHLLAIHRSLRLLFPENKELRFSWVRRRNQAFGGKAPVDIMLEDGVGGLAKVSSALHAQCMQ